MEEIQKKIEKDIDVKEEKKATKTSAKSSKPKTKSTGTKKDTKESKTTVAKTKTSKTGTTTKSTQKPKKSSSAKTTNIEKKEKLEKTTTEKKTKSSKDAVKKETKSPKTTRTKEGTKTSKKTTTTKGKSTKPRTKQEDIVNTEPKFTIIYENKEEVKPEEEKALKTTTKKDKKVEEEQEEKKVVKEQVAQPEEDKNNKEEKPKKRYIEISVGAIICVAIIVGLVLLNIRLVKQAYSAIYNSVTSNNSAEDEDKISVDEEVGITVKNSDEIVSEIKEKITFLPNVTASIFKAETFSSSNISNDLKLRIGWSKVKEEKKLRSINEDNKSIEALEKEVMEENIKNIFGPKIKYKDEAFNNTDVDIFSRYCLNKGTITYDNGLYTSILDENNEDIQNKIEPIIYQEIQRVVKYSDKVVVYVKVAYMDTNEDKYVIYKNFNGKEFEYELTEATQEEIFKDDFNPYTGEGTVTANSNDFLDNIRSELDTYKYTFSLDAETGEYYLAKFNKALSI